MIKKNFKNQLLFFFTAYEEATNAAAGVEQEVQRYSLLLMMNKYIINVKIQSKMKVETEMFHLE